MIQAKNKLIYQIENNIYSVGFGGKHTFDNQIDCKRMDIKLIKNGITIM